MKNLCKKSKQNNIYFTFIQPRNKGISNQDFKPRDYRIKDGGIRHIKFKLFNGKEL